MNGHGGGNLETVQNMNRALVIKLLHRQCTTRAALARSTGLKRATISNIVDDLMQWGLVCEVGNVTGNKGRRSIALDLVSSSYVTICVHMMRDAVIFATLDIRGNQVGQRQKVRTEGLSPAQTIQTIHQKIGELIGEIDVGSGRKLIGIGFAVPGPYIRESGRFALMSRVPGWSAIDFAKQVRASYDIPFFFEHDANCAVLAEWWHGGNAAKYASILFLCAGPGIGAGVIENGNILSGGLGIAGEVGHMSINFAGPICECGHRGCLELYASTFALQSEAASLMEKGFPTCLTREDLSTDAIFAALENGDPLAEKAFQRIAEALGFGIVNLVNVYNPEVIYIGDVLSKAGDRLIRIVDAKARENLHRAVYEKLDIKISHFSTESTILLGINAMVFDNTISSGKLVEVFRRFQ